MEIETVKEHCKHPDCQYRTKLGSGYRTEICAYILYEYEPRRDPISQCTKYKPKEERMRISPYDVLEGVPYDKERTD